MLFEADPDFIANYEQPRIPELQLWNAVLVRAYLDLMNPTTPVPEILAILNWLDLKNKDFKLICELCGYDPAFLLPKIISRIPCRLQKIYNQNLHKKRIIRPNFSIEPERMERIEIQSLKIEDKIKIKKCQYYNYNLFLSFFEWKKKTFWQFSCLQKIAGVYSLPDLTMFADSHIYWMPKYTHVTTSRNSSKSKCLFLSSKIIEYIINGDTILEATLPALLLKIKCPNKSFQQILKENASQLEISRGFTNEN